MDDLSRWLEQEGLAGLASVMHENDIDLDLLPELTPEDLKDLGLTVGQRRRLMKAIAALAEPIAETRPHSADPVPRVALPDAAAARHGTEAADRRQLTVLFCDLVDSTTLSRRLDPEEVRDLYRAYQDTAAGAVTRYGGHVAKFLGDGVLAYFGWPMAFEDQAERAVHAGLEIAAAACDISASDGSTLAVRCGIASGQVVVGDLEHATGTEAGAVSGAVPNLAARLQAAARPGEVLISDETRQLVGTAFETENRGELALKGFEDPVHGHLALRVREVESRFEAMRGGLTTGIVGRTQEIGLLIDRWTQTQAGLGQVVLLSGEAGIGKSRLAEALVERVGESAKNVIRLQCSPHFVNSAYHPVIERARRGAGIIEGDPPDVQTHKLHTMLARDGTDPETALPVYRRLLSIDVDAADGDDRAAAAEIKDRTLHVLADRPIRLAQQGPLLMIIEDVHWIDPSTLEWIERIIPAIADRPVMLVLTHRPDWSTDWTGLFGNVTALTLGHLDTAHIAELMAGVLGTVPGEDLVEDIAKRTEGVPLFVEEFCQAIADRQGTGVPDASTVPPSLQVSVMARLDRLPAAARSLALIAAAIGREFDITLLGQVAGMSGAKLDEALAALRRMRVVFPSGTTQGAFMFRHALIRDTAYASLLTRTRRAHHHAIACALETHHPEVATREPELIAYHHAEAADPSAALPYWMRAAERALSRSAAQEALSHARRAFETAEGSGRDEVKARIYLGRAQESAGQIATSNQTLRETIELARDLDDDGLFIRAVLAFSNTLFLSLEPPDEAIAPLEEALARLSEEDTILQSQVLSHLVRGAVLSGDRDRAERYRGRAIETARQCGDMISLHGIQIVSYVGAAVRRSEEEIADWRTRIDEMLATADAINDDTRARSRSIALYISAEMGDRARMESILERLKEVGAAREHMHIAWVARHGDAMFAILGGRFEEAERCAREALEIGRRAHGSHVEGVYGIQMFTIRREQGRLAEVAPVVKRLVDEDPGAAAWKPGFAVIALELGYEEPGMRVLDEFAETGFNLEYDAKYSTTLSYLAEVAAALHDEPRCETLYELLRPYGELTITAGVTTVCLGAGARYLGRLASALGDWDAARSHFETAIDIERRMQAWPWLAHTRHALAEMLERRGIASDRIEIERLRAEVLEAADQFGMVALRDKCRRQIH